MALTRLNETDPDKAGVPHRTLLLASLAGFGALALLTAASTLIVAVTTGPDNEPSLGNPDAPSAIAEPDFGQMTALRKDDDHATHQAAETADLAKIYGSFDIQQLSAQINQTAIEPRRIGISGAYRAPDIPMRPNATHPMPSIGTPLPRLALSYLGDDQNLWPDFGRPEKHPSQIRQKTLDSPHHAVLRHRYAGAIKASDVKTQRSAFQPIQMPSILKPTEP